MKKKIIIVENNETDYKRTLSILNKISKKDKNLYSYFPSSIDDFYDLRDNFSIINCPSEEIRNDSSKYLLKLFKDADLLLLDYQLGMQGKVKTGFDLYRNLNLENNALIYTNSTSFEIEKIESDIENSGLSEKIKVLKKSKNVGDEAINSLRNNIEYFLKD